MNDFEKFLEKEAKPDYSKEDFGSDPKETYMLGFRDGELKQAKRTLTKYRTMTCQMEFAMGNVSFFSCSHCHEIFDYRQVVQNYCPNCGRRVVVEDNEH
jgi:predicted RNA-binding Zn-ribbon protein involved in translation (DUF1610 family)